MIKIIYLSILCAVIACLSTPLIIKMSLKLNAVDNPNWRKVHISPMPTLGGLAIFISFMVGLLLIQPQSPHHLAIVIGAFVIILLGFFDDLFHLTAKAKFIIQVAAASIVVFYGGLQVEFINLPFGGQIEFGWFSALVTILWIVGITNAINLIDGLDGLAAGVSAIALFTIAVMAIFMDNVYVLSMSIILFWSILGFLPFNFFPAKVFMGDTGALFLGFMIAVLSLLGFKNVTMISFIIPILILAVPIFDTAVAIVRRVIQKRPISSPDSSHLHHRLVKLGMTHRQTVVFMYVLSGMFGVAAILLSMSTVWGAVLIGTISLIVIQILIETLELIDSKFKPLTKLVKRVRG